MFKTHFLAKLNFKTLTKVILSVGLLVLILTRLDMGSVVEQLKHLDGAFWFVALCFMMMQVLALALRWQYLIEHKGRNIEYMEALQITLASLLANYIFIASISGVFVRIGLTVQYGFSVVKTVCAAVIDRFLTLFALVFLAALFLPLMSQHMADADLNNAIYKAVIIGMSLFILLSCVFAPLFFKVVVKQKIMNNRKYVSSLNYLRGLINQPKRITKILFVSLCGQVFYFISIYFLTIATDIHVNMLGLMTVLPAMTLVASLPISIGGWGVREGAFIYGLGLLGVPMEAAFLISVQIGIMGMLTVMLIGMPVVISSDMVRMKKHAILAAQSSARLFDR